MAFALSALVGTAGVAGRAAAGDVDWAMVRVPDHVSAGEMITLELGQAPRDVEEMEILLSLDDGRTFPVRVTREIAAGERRLRWRVPALATASARLRVRFGEDERESWGPLSAPFTIVTGAARADLHLFHENGWWEGLDASSGASPAGDLASGGPALNAGHAVEPLGLPSTSPAFVGRAPVRPLWSLASRVIDPPARSEASALDERFFPLRN